FWVRCAQNGCAVEWNDVIGRCECAERAFLLVTFVTGLTPHSLIDRNDHYGRLSPPKSRFHFTFGSRPVSVGSTFGWLSDISPKPNFWWLFLFTPTVSCSWYS